MWSPRIFFEEFIPVALKISESARFAFQLSEERGRICVAEEAPTGIFEPRFLHF